MDKQKIKEKTTQKDFNLFKSECQKWIEVFGLKGWRVTFRHANLDNDNSARAWNTIQNLEDRVVSIGLCVDWDNDIEGVTDKNIKHSAFHEVMELFLGRMVILAKYRHSTDSEINEENHNIIRTLENVILD